MASLGIRNNNPGNIKKNDTPWQGLAVAQTHKTFFIFKDPKWGIRAIARILITYQDERLSLDGSPIDTIGEIIDRYAPDKENPTKIYAKFVSNRLGLNPDHMIDVYNYETMRDVVTAIIEFENGSQPYDDATIDQGLRLAGIDIPIKPLSKSRTVKGGAIAITSTGAAVAIDVLSELTTAIEPLIQYSDTIKYAFLAITAISAFIMVWARIDDAKKEVRP